jgi:hypothetical protein
MAMTAEFWITTSAIVVGPIAAVAIAQWLQVQQGKRERKLFVLRALMGTRRAQLSQERVVALNLVEIEFSDKQRVVAALRQLLTIYNDRDRWIKEDQAVRRKLLDDLDDSSVRLIEEIAVSLGYKFDQIDILRGGYYPEAFGVQEEQQRIIREFIVGLRQGTLLLPVAVLDYHNAPKGGQENAEKAQP